MRQQSRFATTLVLAVAVFFGLSAFGQTENDLTECSALASYKYKPQFNGKSYCKITLTRASPGSPLPVQVPPDTNVLIFVDHQQANEIIQAVVTNDAVAQPDILGGIVGKLTGPLGSVAFKTISTPLDAGVASPPPSAKNQIQFDQALLYAALQVIYKGYIEPTCLQAYVAFDDDKYTCNAATPLTASTFETARQTALDDLEQAIDVPTISADAVGNLEGRVNTECPSDHYAGSDQCAELKSNQQNIDALFGLLNSKAKTILPTFYATLKFWQPLTDTQLPVYSKKRDRKLTIKVSGQEQIGLTSTLIATVVITWQQTNWGLSTGVVLSSLKNKTFADAPIYNADGTPKTDGSGKTLTQVTVTKTYPGIISPVFLVNYRLYNLQKWSGRTAFLLSGGLGLNPVSKGADFAIGPSMQVGSVIFSGVLHYGRQTQLTGGVHVGDQLGTSPPALPTAFIYKPAVGIGITYRLPLP